MKKFLFTVVLMLGAFVHTEAATTNSNFGKLTIEDVLSISRTISENTNDTLYAVDFNCDFSTMRDMLDFNYAQARDIYRLQKYIAKKLRVINTIEDEDERTLKFNNLIRDWRYLSKKYIMYNIFDNRLTDDAWHQYRIYWSIVNTTMNYKEYSTLII